VDTKYSLLPLDVSTPTWMRGPGEATGSFGLETALDELAHKLKMDPIELRIKNFSEINQENKMPFSANFLKDCYQYGMDKIGWKNRSMIPGKVKENGWLVGYGMAVGVFGANKGSASVRAVFNKDGSLVLESAVSDMGPGTPTAMTKIAASVLQMSAQKIKFKLGDSDLPPGPTQGGSGTTSSLGSAVDLICNNIIKELKKLAIQFAPSFKAITEDAIEIKNDLVQSKTGTEKISLQELFQLAGKSNIDLTVTSTGNGAQPLKYATNSFSAHFVKVLVHPQKGTIDIQHIVSTGDAGKIISENTARSQMLGGVVGGIGMAMSEQVEWDHTSGQIINASFGGYQVPRHKNIPNTDVWFVNKPDPYINSIGAKGLGEIAFIGLAAAISSAVFNATGKRVRDLPITPQKLGFKAAV
jgi:xanthine dehydrogenase YagR molybdenum-binding subunit